MVINNLCCTVLYVTIASYCITRIKQRTSVSWTLKADTVWAVYPKVGMFWPKLTHKQTHKPTLDKLLLDVIGQVVLRISPPGPEKDEDEENEDEADH